MSVQRLSVSILNDGREVSQYCIQNNNGLSVCLLDLGAIIQSVMTPDQKGNVQDIVLGFDHPQQYLDSTSYFGAVIGRCANRIKHGKFELAGKQYQLDCNNADNHLHGGIKGFDKRLWQTTILSESSILFSLYSEDGDQGYPGGLWVSVTYVLTEQNELHITYDAKSEQTTILNLTQHSYFNLSGNPAKDVLDHQVQINAKAYTPVDAHLIPDGELRSVENSPFDFRQPTLLAKALDLTNSQLSIAHGYDHNFVLNKRTIEQPYAAIINHSPSGRQLCVATDMPGMQFYTGNFLNKSDSGKGNISYGLRSGLCLETQYFPNAINQENFPSVVLPAEQAWQSTTIFSFNTLKPAQNSH